MHGGSSESSGLGDLFESLTDHLTATHKVFLKQWDRLIDLEAKESQVCVTYLKFFQSYCLLGQY